MKRMPFNMIEILLALGVIAIGAVSVLALFPYGFSASRDSVAESFASDSADQFLNWFSAQAQRDWGTFAAAGSWWLPNSKPTVPSGPTGTESNNWSAEQSITPNLKYRRHNDDGVLNVTFQRGDASQPIVDFSGVYRTWRDTVTLPDPRPDSGGAPVTLNTDSALAINLEASWPSELPYIRRQKRVYRIEIFRPSGG